MKKIKKFVLSALVMPLSAAWAGPEIEFDAVGLDGMPRTGGSAFISDQVGIRVSGLPAKTSVTLTMEAGSQSSMAVFRSDDFGRIDLAAQAPLSGSYSGIDPDGMIWSMRPASRSSGSKSPLDLLLRVSVDGRELASKSLHRYFPDPSVRRFSVQGQKFIGELYRPVQEKPRPMLVVLGGGEGGLGGASFLAAFYASQGYAALAVAYFGLPGIPSGIDRIPVEYFKSAIDWMREQPFAKDQKLGLVGGSRGAEAALAVASVYGASIDAVVVDMGNPFPLSGYDLKAYREIAPWTFEGEDLPFQRNLQFGKETYRVHENGIRAFEFKSTRRWDILESAAAMEAAFLPIERIQAPVLFNAGEDDALWPTAELSRMAFLRRQRKEVGQRDEFYSYPRVGHVLGSVPGFPRPETYIQFPVENGKLEYWELGGEPQENAQATRLSMARNLSFLAQYLK